MAAIENKLKLSDVADDACTEEENDEEKDREEQRERERKNQGKTALNIGLRIERRFDFEHSALSILYSKFENCIFLFQCYLSC